MPQTPECARSFAAGAALAIGALCAVTPSLALELVLPERTQETATDRAFGDAASLPLGPALDGPPPAASAEGTIVRTAWAIPESVLTTLQILAPLREQLEAQGYEALYECADDACGGFDFRFHLDLLAEPDMRVDLGDYRYLLVSTESDAGTAWAALTVSRGASTGFVHLTTVVPGVSAETPEVTIPEPDPDENTGTADPTGEQTGLIDQLLSEGSVALDDLEFQTGFSALGDTAFESLTVLGRYLRENPSVTVVLVGHTDAAGTLANNVALSRRRAAAVLDRLADRHNVPRTQMRAEGVGFLAPRASNDTAQGRAANRRVEAVKLING